MADTILEYRTGEMRSPRHSLLIRPYAFGQFRIVLTRVDHPDFWAPAGHGAILREL